MISIIRIGIQTIPKYRTPEFRQDLGTGEKVKGWVGLSSAIMAKFKSHVIKECTIPDDLCNQ